MQKYFQHPFLKKALNKLGTEETCLNITQAMCSKPTVNIILDAKTLKAFPRKLRIRNYLTTLKQHRTESPRQGNQARKKKMKCIQIRKEEVKWSPQIA